MTNKIPVAGVPPRTGTTNDHWGVTAMRTNTRLAVMVASVAVAAVAIGGAVASQQGPVAAGSAAAPLSPLTSLAPPGSTPTPSAPQSQPRTTPTPTAPSKQVPSTKQTPTPPPPPTSTGPVEVAVVPAKLSKGTAPQVPYLVDREVRGGGGRTTKIPGTDTIHTVVRRGNATLATVSSPSPNGERLVTIEDGKATYTPGVRSLVGSRNGAARPTR